MGRHRGRGQAGSGGCATDTAADKWAKCNAVYTYLSGLAKSANGYATSPIWGVVDGPLKLSSFNTDGYVTFVPNKSYSGSPKPELDAVKLVPYTDDTTEYTGLKTGAVDVGYVPPSDLAHVSGSEILPPTSPSRGYSLVAVLLLRDPVLPDQLPQPEDRADLQPAVRPPGAAGVMDQEGMIKAIDNGYGYPTSGAVPEEPVEPVDPVGPEPERWPGPVRLLHLVGHRPC